MVSKSTNSSADSAANRSTTNATTNCLVVIDSQLDQHQVLLNGIVEGAEVLVLDQQQDGIAQITEALANRRSVQALHIFSHAMPGCLTLGAEQITSSTLSSHAHSLQHWSRALAANAEILLYGCQLAAGAAGRALVYKMARLTQRAIAASETLTGSARLGGDWRLSVQTAPIQARSVLHPEAMAAYDAVMANAVFDWSDPSINWPGGEIGTVVFPNVDGTGVDFTIDISTTPGVTFGNAPSQVGAQTPDDIQFLQGGETVAPVALHITMDNATNQDAVTTTVSFSRAIGRVSFAIFDVDEDFVASGWQDEVEIIGFRRNEIVQPTLTAVDNAAYVIDGNVATGVSNAVNTGPGSETGTVFVSFDSRITGYQVIYRNGPQAADNPGEQGIAILSNIFFRVRQTDENQPPETENVQIRTTPDNVRRVPGLSGTDPDGTVERFRIVSVPPSRQGTLFLGNPNRNGRELEAGDRIRANNIDRVFFQSSTNFNGTRFEYAAIDDQGLQDPTPARVRIQLRGDDPDPNQRPITDDVTNRIEPDSLSRLRRLGGSDPDGTVEQFRIVSLPRPGQGTLFVGNPNRNGVPAQEGQDIDADDIGRLFFQAAPDFTGVRFQYAAIDNLGAIDRSPATVRLIPRGTSDNQPPEVVPFSIANLVPGSTRRLRELDATDPDGDDTLESFTIRRQTPRNQGTLFLGNPARRGTPVEPNEPIDIEDINRIFFVSTDDFLEGEVRFRYFATDNQGANSRPAQVTISPTAGPGGGRPTRPGCPRGERIVGTRQDDRLVGTPANDVIIGLAGDDVIRGRGCDDLIRGRSGDDRLFGDAGNDVLFGGRGDDTLRGGTGRDRLFGNGGNDVLRGGRDNDVARGGPGDDTIFGGAGDDRLFGGSGDDTIFGGSGRDFISGGPGDDVIRGGRGNDTLYGNSGDDRIRGEQGDDLIFGGNGNDILRGGNGDDTIFGGNGNDTIFGGAGDDVIRGGNGDNFIFGGAGNDRITGNAGNDFIRAGRGRDTVNGGRGDDFIVGRAGNDRLRGGAGNDTLRGNAGDDILIGNRGNDRLNGGPGNNLMIGGLGEDTMTGGRGSDTFMYRTVRDGGATGDRIRRFNVARDFIDLQPLFDRYNRFSANNPFRRYVSLRQDGNNTLMSINVAGENGQNDRLFATIVGVEASDLSRNNFII
jgi:Ca2+-binding RTX toxin-like protein